MKNSFQNKRWLEPFWSNLASRKLCKRCDCLRLWALFVCISSSSSEFTRKSNSVCSIANASSTLQLIWMITGAKEDWGCADYFRVPVRIQRRISKEMFLCAININRGFSFKESPSPHQSLMRARLWGSGSSPLEYPAAAAGLLPRITRNHPCAPNTCSLMAFRWAASALAFVF